MTRSSWALLVLVPLFLFTTGPIIGASHAEVVDWYGRPLVALITAATLIVGMLHFASGIQVVIEDYTPSPQREKLIGLARMVSYGLMGLGLLSLLIILFK
ncbi:succinate dehydrogenase [Alphaproteobacteria bacterium KMM 3653]|uniref:Succinate dehydrogenase n=2 Tax=Harenicola maris TaxID=2841044 RepID=A0AAP2CUR9_9RHOB|nr:succinate dehydrogenase [Harenicola maris]